MDAKLKYLFFLSFAACLASSCTSDAPDHEGVGKGSEMSFDVSDLSRAVTTSFNQFSLYGDMKFPVDNATVPSVIFDNTPVEYISNCWSYADTRYWYPKHEHSFVAISPLSVLSADNNPLYTNSQLSFTYTLPSSAGIVDKNDVTDIIAATHRRLYAETEKNTTVTLRFGHIMSKINLAPAFNDNTFGQDDFILINKVELTGLSVKGRFSVFPASRQSNSQTDDRVINVTDQEGSGHMVIEFADPLKVVNRQARFNLFDEDEAIILLPQAFAPDSDARIIIHYSDSRTDTPKEGSLPLMNQKWDSGKSYIYRFTIDRSGMLLDATTITDWDAMEVGNIDAH